MVKLAVLAVAIINHRLAPASGFDSRPTHSLSFCFLLSHYFTTYIQIEVGRWVEKGFSFACFVGVRLFTLITPWEPGLSSLNIILHFLPMQTSDFFFIYNIRLPIPAHPISIPPNNLYPADWLMICTVPASDSQCFLTPGAVTPMSDCACMVCCFQ